MSTPSVGRLVSELEDDLGLRPFQRSTRQVGLPEEGGADLNRAGVLVDELEVVSAEMRELRSRPRGHPRIGSVVAFGQERIAPAVPGFMARYPDVAVDLQSGNRKVDLIREHVDLAIRIGGADGLDASGLVAEPIARGELQRALPDHATVDQPIYAVFVHRACMPAKLRAFIDYLVETPGVRPSV